MGNSTYKILLGDLEALENEFSVLDPAYRRAPAAPPFNQTFFRDYWRTAPRLGDPSFAREANIQVGVWTPDIVLPAGVAATSDPASIRVLGHRLSIRQLGLILEPFWAIGGPVSVYERLICELSVVDFFAFEEAIFTGNTRSQTSSLIDEWSNLSPVHKGIDALKQVSFSIPSQWRDPVRNKICAHLDQDIPASDLEVGRWPMDRHELNQKINRLCGLLEKAAVLDPRTSSMCARTLSLPRVVQPYRPDVPRWAET